MVRGGEKGRHPACSLLCPGRQSCVEVSARVWRGGRTTCLSTHTSSPTALVFHSSPNMSLKTSLCATVAPPRKPSGDGQQIVVSRRAKRRQTVCKFPCYKIYKGPHHRARGWREHLHAIRGRCDRTAKVAQRPNARVADHERHVADRLRSARDMFPADTVCRTMACPRSDSGAEQRCWPGL